jgi:hypothetical protein
MKRLMTLAAFLMLLVAPAWAQQSQGQDETVTVPKSMLSKDQIDALAQKNLQDKVDRYGKWVGVGHEIGTAVNESLSAINAQANSFAQTPVGKWTIFVVVYKIVGRDLMGFVIGLGTLAVGLPLWIWSYRRYLPHNIPLEITYDNSKWIRRVQSIKYKTVMDEDDESANWYRGFHFLFLLVLFGLSMWVMW